MRARTAWFLVIGSARVGRHKRCGLGRCIPHQKTIDEDEDDERTHGRATHLRGVLPCRASKSYSAHLPRHRTIERGEDIVQESFTKVWERWDTVGSHPDPSAYLYRVAFNLHRNRRRRARLAAKRAFATSASSDAFEMVEQREVLVQALRSLSERQRAAVVLMDLMDMSSDAASEYLGVKPSTVRVLAARHGCAENRFGAR